MSKDFSEDPSPSLSEQDNECDILPLDLKEVAERELNETEERRNQALKDLKELIQGESYLPRVKTWTVATEVECTEHGGMKHAGASARVFAIIALRNNTDEETPWT